MPCLRSSKREGALPGAGQQQIYRVPVWKGDLYNKNMVIFAGDSAGQVLPLTHEGIYYAMKAGELAAIAIPGRESWTIIRKGGRQGFRKGSVSWPNSEIIF